MRGIIKRFLVLSNINCLPANKIDAPHYVGRQHAKLMLSACELSGVVRSWRGDNYQTTHRQHLQIVNYC